MITNSGETNTGSDVTIIIHRHAFYLFIARVPD